jgi:hypothetical protein
MITSTSFLQLFSQLASTHVLRGIETILCPVLELGGSMEYTGQMAQQREVNATCYGDSQVTIAVRILEPIVLSF